MGFQIRGTLTGLEAVTKAMMKLRGPVRRKVMRAGMRKLTSLMNKTAKGLAPVRTGQLKRSLGVKVKIYPSGIVFGAVEPRGGFKTMVDGKPVNPVKYAHLAERGTKARALKSGKSVGAAPAQPFMQPAFDRNQNRAPELFGAELDKELAKL